MSALSVIFIIHYIRKQIEHCDEEYSEKILKRASIAMIILEIFRIGWSSFYYGAGIRNIRFDWCNQICMVLPFIVLSGSKALFPYIDSLAFLGGAGVIVYPVWVFYDYAGIHIMSVQSMVSHSLMIIISVSMSFVSNHWAEERGIRKPLMGFGCIAAVAFVMSRLLNTNYLIMLRADGIPILRHFSFPWYWIIAFPLVVLAVKVTKSIFMEVNSTFNNRKKAAELNVIGRCSSVEEIEEIQKV